MTGYTPLVNGLRKKDEHEITAMQTECDVKQEFKDIYDYIVFLYISVSIILPFIFVSYFNLFIVYVLLTRKNKTFRQSFKVTESSNLQSESPAYRTNVETNQFDIRKSELNHVKLITHSIKNNVPIDKRIDASTDYLKMQKIRDKNFSIRNQINKKSSFASQSSNKKEFKIKYSKAKEETYFSSLKIQESTKRKISLYSEINIHKKMTNFRSNSCYLEKISSLSLGHPLRNAERATLILILISISFVSLNLPYVVAWMRFFIPFKRNQLSQREIFYRYSFVSLTEIFHMINYCINIFLYCMVSKAFRNEIRSRISFECCYSKAK